MVKCQKWHSLHECWLLPYVFLCYSYITPKLSFLCTPLECSGWYALLEFWRLSLISIGPCKAAVSVNLSCIYIRQSGQILYSLSSLFSHKASSLPWSAVSNYFTLHCLHCHNKPSYCYGHAHTPWPTANQTCGTVGTDVVERLLLDPNKMSLCAFSYELHVLTSVLQLPSNVIMRPQCNQCWFVQSGVLARWIFSGLLGQHVFLLTLCCTHSNSWSFAEAGWLSRLVI